MCIRDSSNPFERLQSGGTARRVCVGCAGTGAGSTVQGAPRHGAGDSPAGGTGRTPAGTAGHDPPGRARLYADGLTLAHVATQLGTSIEAVRSAVVACGGTVRPGGRRSVGTSGCRLLTVSRPSTYRDALTGLGTCGEARDRHLGAHRGSAWPGEPPAAEETNTVATGSSYR